MTLPFSKPIDQPTVGDMEREAKRRNRRYREPGETPVPSAGPFKPSVLLRNSGFQSYEHDNEDLLDKPAFLRRD